MGEWQTFARAELIASLSAVSFRVLSGKEFSGWTDKQHVADCARRLRGRLQEVASSGLIMICGSKSRTSCQIFNCARTTFRGRIGHPKPMTQPIH